MNRPENIIGLIVENTERVDKFLLVVFNWNTIIYNASSRFSTKPHDPEIEEKLKLYMNDCGWSDAIRVGNCEAGVLLFKYTEKASTSRLFFYDLLRNRCGYAVPVFEGSELIYYEVTNV